MLDKNEILKIYGHDYKEMTKHLLVFAQLKNMIPENARIGIKPNLVSPTPASFGATTHPEIVAGIIEYLQENSFNNIVVMEGSWVGDKTSDAFEYCGYNALSEKYGVLLIDAQKDSCLAVSCAGMDINICDCARNVDFLINVPVLKGHGQTKITCALKNIKGLIPNTEKRLFHKLGLHRPVAQLQMGIRQNFIVVDHICGDLELEDGGNPVQTDCIMAALDPVLVDSYVCSILGYTAEDVEYIKLAEKLGVGCADLSRGVIKVLDTDTSSLASHSAADSDPQEIKRTPSDILMQICQNVEDVESCSACYGALVPALKRLQAEGKLEDVMNHIGGKILIGQGNSGKEGTFGVGNCCRNFQRFIPGCPPSEDDIYNYLCEPGGRG